MKLIRSIAYACAAAACGAFVASPALADNDHGGATHDEQNEPAQHHKHVRKGEKAGTTTTTSAPQPNVPPPRSYDEPAPPARAATAPPPEHLGITKEAGIGGTQAYSRAGVLELGGSAGLARASNFTQFNFSPSVGWFFMDNIELSGIIGVNYIDTDTGSSTFMTFLAEPSFHLPVTNYLFPFVGIGAGIGYAKGPGTGFALAPRIGLNVLVGRSGILTPALTLVYNTASAVTSTGTVSASAAYGFNVGYTVMY